MINVLEDCGTTLAHLDRLKESVRSRCWAAAFVAKKRHFKLPWRSHTLVLNMMEHKTASVSLLLDSASRLKANRKATSVSLNGSKKN